MKLSLSLSLAGDRTNDSERKTRRRNLSSFVLFYARIFRWPLLLLRRRRRAVRARTPRPHGLHGKALPNRPKWAIRSDRRRATRTTAALSFLPSLFLPDCEGHRLLKWNVPRSLTPYSSISELWKARRAPYWDDRAVSEC